jgi:predicted  nucleic acid-binding Zn-ribbon protein
MNKNREYDRLNARIEELERQVADLQRSLDEIAPGYKELARYVADMRARLHEVEENVYRPWRSAA